MHKKNSAFSNLFVLLGFFSAMALMTGKQHWRYYHIWQSVKKSHTVWCWQ